MSTASWAARKKEQQQPIQWRDVANFQHTSVGVRMSTAIASCTQRLERPTSEDRPEVASVVTDDHGQRP